MSTPNESCDGNLNTDANTLANDRERLSVFTVTIGATVPTGFEHTAAEEVGEKIGAEARISKDRGRIYFEISTDKLPMVSFDMISLMSVFTLCQPCKSCQVGFKCALDLITLSSNDC